MRKIEIGRKALNLSQAHHTIVYYITVDDLCDDVTGVTRVLYGVGVTIAETGETEIVSSVNFSRRDAVYLAQLMADHLVTPVTVGDVILDWLVVN